MLNFKLSAHFLLNSEIRSGPKPDSPTQKTGGLRDCRTQPYFQTYRTFMKRHENHRDKLLCPRAAHAFSFLFVFLMTALLCCCGKKDAPKPQDHISTPADLNSPKYVIGVVSETISCKEAKKSFPQAQFREY